MPQLWLPPGGRTGKGACPARARPTGGKAGSALLRFVQTVKEAFTGLERVSVPPEDILMALTEGGMPCTVQELLARFRRFVEKRTEGKDPNKVRIVVEW